MTGPDLHAIRARFGLSQPEFAELLGIFGPSRGSKVSDMERGVKAVPWKTAQLALCYLALGLSRVQQITARNPPEGSAAK